MNRYVQLVQPRTSTKDWAGWCLRFTQTVFAAPVAHPSAKAAANATKHRHYTQAMPDKSVPVWFDHWGTYGGVYANWGHVVAWVPGRGFLSSPGSGHGQQWFPTILAVERMFNAKFLFWTEDINTLRVAEPAPIKEEDPMPKSTRHTYRPKNGRKITDKWTYLTLNDKGDITVIAGGAKGRRVQALCNLDVRGVVDVRAVVEQTSADGKKVIKSNGDYYGRIERLGTHAASLDVPAGYRLRFQARTIDKTPVIVGQMGYVTDYWEK